MKKLILLLILMLCSILYGQTQHDCLPLSQPFNISPWNYNGTEEVDSIPYNVKDWMLFELRSSIDSVDVRVAGFLCTDGKARDLTATRNLRYGNLTGFYYLVCIDRLSLPVMSAEKLEFVDGYLKYDYDFTTSSDKAYGGTNAMTYDSTSGKWSFYAGDTNRDGVINILDYQEVSNNLFNQGYYQGDTDRNCIVNVLDYKFISQNLFKFSLIPMR